MSLRLTVVLLLSFVCFAAPAWADYKAAVAGYARGDFATAAREMRTLAEQGDAVAQYNLGLLHNNGQGVPRDYGRAREWYEKAAAQGDADAQAGLGTLYLNGHGVSEDYHQALFWLRLAADQRNSLAQIKPGIMYEEGKGVPQDFVLAHKWYNLGGANGLKASAHLRDVLEKKMTPNQIAEAQQLAREWSQRNPKPQAELRGSETLPGDPLSGLCVFVRIPSTIRLSARLPCPSRFVSIVACRWPTSQVSGYWSHSW